MHKDRHEAGIILTSGVLTPSVAPATSVATSNVVYVVFFSSPLKTCVLEPQIRTWL